MSELLYFAVGLITFPVLGGLYLLFVKLFLRDATIEERCDICGFSTTTERPIVRWVKWKWHDIIPGWRPWHRKALDDYRRKWKLGKYRA